MQNEVSNARGKAAEQVKMNGSLNFEKTLENFVLSLLFRINRSRIFVSSLSYRTKLQNFITEQKFVRTPRKN